MTKITEKVFWGDKLLSDENDRIKADRSGKIAALLSAAKIDNTECLLLLSYGIGDYLIAMGLAKAFEAKHGLKIGAFAGRPDLGFLSELFPAPKDYINFMTADADAPLANEIVGGGAFYTHFPNFELSKMIGYRGLTLFDAHKCRLGLAANADFTLPNPANSTELNSAISSLQNNNLQPGKTVFISTKARSVKWSLIPLEFWRSLAKRLRKTGFGINFLDNDALNAEFGVTPMNLDLKHFRASIMSAGHFVSLRSGLSDLAVNLGIRHTDITPPGIPFEHARVSDLGGNNGLNEVSLDETNGAKDALLEKIIQFHIAE